jgi:uncharacterized membrane protein YfcA
LLIYLPIADLPLNIFVLLATGLAVGFVSGMFGVGGGFLMTPLLIFLGISPGVAVASVASHITASSFSGALSYWRRRAVDIPMAMFLLSGGLLGTWSGVWIFTTLRSLGQLDLLIAFSYLIMLSAVGALMVMESVRSIVRQRQNKPSLLRRSGAHIWVHGLPIKFRFRRSKIYVSLIPIWGIGYIIGTVGAVMGIGGGFLLVPMLIYFLRVPTSMVIGTSAVLTTTTMAMATVMHALTNHLVDAVLALVLMVGGVIGAQFGARAALNMPAERLRFLLGFLILAVGCRFGYELITRPDNLYSIRAIGTEL